MATTAADDEGQLLMPDDPLFEMVGLIDSGIDELGPNHDFYLYGAPRRDPPPAAKPEQKPRSRRRARLRKSSL